MRSGRRLRHTRLGRAYWPQSVLLSEQWRRLQRWGQGGLASNKLDSRLEGNRFVTFRTQTERTEGWKHCTTTNLSLLRTHAAHMHVQQRHVQSHELALCCGWCQHAKPTNESLVKESATAQHWGPVKYFYFHGSQINFSYRSAEACGLGHTT